MNSAPSITESDLADYLVSTPSFFERHAEVLTSISIANPYGQGVVNLHQRQAQLLGGKIKVLEQRVMELVRHGNQNAVINHKLHQLACALVAVQEATAVPATVVQGLRTLFDVPQVALRVWGVGAAHAESPFAQGVSADVRAFASSLTDPFCGPNRGFEVTGWLQDAQQVQSLALLPLREGVAAEDPTNDAGAFRLQPAFGLLVLASHDAQRFEANMGTDFLVRMAEVVGAALGRIR